MKKLFYNLIPILIVGTIAIMSLYEACKGNYNLYHVRNYAILSLAHLLYCWFSSKKHEKAHWKEAAKYHKLINPKMTNNHFDCDNWEEFLPEEIKNVALAGIKFDMKSNVLFLLLAFIQPLTVVLTFVLMFWNAVPVRFSENSATDGYWYLHPDEFLASKRQ